MLTTAILKILEKKGRYCAVMSKFSRLACDWLKIAGLTNPMYLAQAGDWGEGERRRKINNQSVE
jgi:hypothetical protein